MPDKFSATWVSHSSISDFLSCPLAYFYKNVYKDPKSGKKIQLVTPALTLGSAVHEVLESLSVMKTDQRFAISLIERLAQIWPKYAGRKGGFSTQDQESHYRLEAEDMLRRAIQNPGPLKKLAVKIKEDLPQYWLSLQDEIILCGKIDWLEYDSEENSVHIIDFKTSKKPVSQDSLQLPIYRLLVTNTQHREVSGMSYWYLRFADAPTQQDLPAVLDSHNLVLEQAKKIKLARKLGRFVCPNKDAGCAHCRPFKRIIDGEVEQVGISQYGQQVYAIFGDHLLEKESLVL